MAPENGASVAGLHAAPPHEAVPSCVANRTCVGQAPGMVVVVLPAVAVVVVVVGTGVVLVVGRVVLVVVDVLGAVELVVVGDGGRLVLVVVGGGSVVAGPTSFTEGAHRSFPFPSEKNCVPN